MAEGNQPFNPEVQTQTPPSWWFWQEKGITQPKPAEAGKYALETAGKAIGEGFKEADMLAKDGLESQIHGKIDPIREDYINQLQDRYRQVSGHGVPGTDVLATDQETEHQPEELKGLKGQAETLSAAKSSGKFSASYIDTQYHQVAQYFRQKYPGYRDYIDRIVNEETGRGEANKLVGSLMSDINSFVGKKEEGRNRLIGFVQQNAQEDPAAFGVIMHKIMTNPKYTADQAYQESFQALQTHYNIKQFHEQVGHAEDVDKAANLAAKGTASVASQLVQQRLNNISVVGQESKPGEHFNEFVNTPHTDKEWSEMGASVKQASISARRDLDAFYDKDLGQGRTLRGIKGLEVASKEIEDLMKPFNAYSEAIDNKEGGLSYRTALGNAATMSGFMKPILDDPKLGPYAGVIGEASRISPAFGQRMQEILQNDGFSPQGPAVDHVMSQIFSQYNPKRQQSGEPGSDKPFTVSDAVAIGKRVGFTKKDMNTLTHMPEFITDPTFDARGRYNTALAFFDPSSEEFLKNINPDGWKDGKFVEGRHSAYDRFFNFDTAKETKKLAEKFGDKHLWDNYKDVQQDVFQYLFRGDLSDLNGLITPQHGFAVSYDSDSHNFALRHTKSVEGYSQQGRLEDEAKARRLINTINTGIHSLADTAKAEKSDPAFVNAFVFKTLKDMLPMSRLPGSITDDMYQQVLAHGVPKTAEKQE